MSDQKNPQIKDDKYWQSKLTPEQYRVLRLKETETPFTGKYVNNHETGMYQCAACGADLFSSETKFDSGTGWPSFDNPVNTENVILQDDNAYGMQRTEVICKNCGSHLGHLFDDSRSKTGKDYCINSCALNFKKTSMDPESSSG